MDGERVPKISKLVTKRDMSARQPNCSTSRRRFRGMTSGST